MKTAFERLIEEARRHDKAQALVDAYRAYSFTIDLDKPETLIGAIIVEGESGGWNPGSPMALKVRTALPRMAEMLEAANSRWVDDALVAQRNKALGELDEARAEVKRLREALEKLRKPHCSACTPNDCYCSEDAKLIRAAIAGGDHE